MNSLNDKIIELWHVSRIALAGKLPSHYDRMIYVKNELKNSSPELIEGISAKRVWFAIEDAIN